MKRSEMIQNIQDYLDLIKVTSPDFSNEEIAEYILLGCCEPMGMLPPDIALCHPELNHVCYEWEEEDGEET